MPRMIATTSLIDQLNAPQREAVTVNNQHCLVLAGAGSGKTRVLVHRIAWLMSEQGVSPYSILSVTFTNKAASEMRGRIESLRGIPLTGMWVGTFHGLAHRLLRTHWQEAGLPQSFQILDSDDQQRMLKRIIRSMELDEERWQPKKAQWFINGHKENGRRPDHINNDGDYYNDVMIKIYRQYEAACEQGGLVDFAELLLRSLEMLQNNPELTEHYHQRFAHILVDEFQDTNTLQYQWLRQLCGEGSWMMVVGDDDQSIYSWRGAKVENIQRFIDQYAPVKTVRLEQNYRSTENILAAANAVIEFNSQRMGKQLWTDIGRGDPITVYAAFNERDEAYYIAARLQDWLNQGNSLSEAAILYRSNAQSRILEERLIDCQIPYRIYGGQKFFDRAEIKDALAYLRLVNHRHDDAAFERVVNMPTRGIGDATMGHLRNITFTNQLSLWQAALLTIDEKSLSARAVNALSKFIELINRCDTDSEGLKLGEQTQLVIAHSGLLAHYQKDRSERGQSRVDNLEELVNATSQYEPSDDEEAQEQNLSPLAAFLAHVALEAGENQADKNSDSVSMMTLHAAKGLEFPLIFITGMEENLFPHRMSIEQREGLEEERRLCYVGMTRAMKKLYLCHAESRSLYGREQFQKPSRFLGEIPNELLDHVRPTARSGRMQNFRRPNERSNRASTTLRNQPADQTGFNVGQRVSHKKFGDGTLMNFEGQGEHTRLQVKFDSYGTKWLVASFAKLQSL